jgi:hypothetical protein
LVGAGPASSCAIRCISWSLSPVDMPESQSSDSSLLLLLCAGVLSACVRVGVSRAARTHTTNHARGAVRIVKSERRTSFCPRLKRPRETSRTKVKSCNHWGLLTTDESMAFYNLPTRSYCTAEESPATETRHSASGVELSPSIQCKPGVTALVSSPCFPPPAPARARASFQSRRRHERRRITPAVVGASQGAIGAAFRSEVCCPRAHGLQLRLCRLRARMPHSPRARSRQLPN